MSIATLKKKTASKYNNNSVNTPHFSLNGTYRSQGYIGQTSLSRSLPRSLAVGPVMKGHGGCCGKYELTPPILSAVYSTEDNRVVKPSVLSSTGMVATKFKWLNGHQTVKPVYQGDYITRKKQQAICEAHVDPSVCSLFKPESTYIVPSQSFYLETLHNKCLALDKIPPPRTTNGIPQN